MSRSKAKTKKSLRGDMLYNFLAAENPFESKVIEIFYTSHRTALNEDIRKVGEDMINALNKAKERVETESAKQEATAAAR